MGIRSLISYLPDGIRNRLYYRFLVGSAFPEVIHIENTNACNADCIMCPREKMTRATGFMDGALFKKIIDECAARREVKEVHLHGYGECLLEKDFASKVAYAKQKGIKSTYVVTNGSLLTEAAARGLIEGGLDKIKISFYGATKPAYERIHRKLRFEDVENNIRGLFAQRERSGRKNPAVTLQFLPQEQNSGEKDMFREKWQPYLNAGYGDTLSEYKLHNYGGGRCYNAARGRKGRVRKCVLPFNTMQILWNGDVVPCCFDFNGRMILDNVRSRSIMEAWNSRVIAQFRLAHRRSEFKGYALCAQCDQILPR
jgi:radical SAM protein with 4Fe4S-binding SPASM domain